MNDVPKTILSSLEALFLQFNIRRLLFWVFIILTIGILVVLGEGLTGYIFFTKMERKASLLKELNSLAQNGVAENSELSPIYNEMVSELASYEVEPFSIAQIKHMLYIPEWFKKFVSGGLLGFLVALSGLAERKNASERWAALTFGGLFFGIVMGLLGSVIPTIYHPWVNYLGYPIIQIMMILLPPKITQRLRERKTQ